MFIKKWLSTGNKEEKKSQLPAGNKDAKKTQSIKKDDYSSLVRVYMPVRDLELGMHVAELDRPWLESPFLFQGFEIKTEAELKTLRQVCEYVYVDMTRKKTNKSSLDAEAELNLPKTINNATPPQKLSVFENEITRAEKIYENTQVIVSDFMEKIVQGGEIDTKLAKEVVSDCINSILHSPDAMLWLTQMKNKHEYTAQHSLNVCVLSIVLGRHLNYSKAYLNVLGLCGMMHDMGKMLVPSEILIKEGPLTPEELRIMQTHAQLGYELLKSTEGMHRSAAEVAYTHHEHMNGKGYPRQIGQDDISHITRIVTIADVYDAITSEKPYQKGRTHLEATGILTQLVGTHLDPVLVYKFIESVGVYPPGCLVEMTNGAIAIVVEVNENLKLRPKIIIILDEEKNPVPEKVLDLSEMVRDNRGELYTIKSIVKAEDWKIDATRYYQEGVLQKGFARGKKKS